MKRSFFIIAAVIGSAALGACSTHTNANPTMSARAFAPVCVEGVAVYQNFGEVPHDYQEVAFITAEQNSVYNDKTEMITDMRKKAGEQGGNGLVINSISASKSTVKQIGEALGTNSAEREGRAVAIYMPADAKRVKNACGH